MELTGDLNPCCSESLLYPRPPRGSCVMQRSNRDEGAVRHVENKQPGRCVKRSDFIVVLIGTKLGRSWIKARIKRRGVSTCHTSPIRWVLSEKKGLSVNIFIIVTCSYNNVISTVYLIEFAVVFQLLSAGCKWCVFISSSDKVDKDGRMGTDVTGCLSLLYPGRVKILTDTGWNKMCEVLHSHGEKHDSYCFWDVTPSYVACSNQRF